MFFLSGEATLAFWKPQLSHRYVELALKARLKSQFVLGLNLERNPRGQIVLRWLLLELCFELLIALEGWDAYGCENLTEQGTHLILNICGWERV